MKRWGKRLGAVALVTVLWFVGAYRPCAEKRRGLELKVAQVEARSAELLNENPSASSRRTEEVELVNKIGYKRPTTDAEQVARMVEQIETACVMSSVGLVEIVPLEREKVKGPSFVDSLSGKSKDLEFSSYPAQIQTVGELGGTVTLLSLFRSTSPMMQVDRLTLTSEADGLIRARGRVSSMRPETSGVTKEGAR
jgi:hypothetical protein